MGTTVRLPFVKVDFSSARQTALSHSIYPAFV